MNNDLISRSEIRKHILNMTGMFTDELGFVLSSDAVIGAIETVPTIDAVKVVRCKDCRRWGTGYGGETEKVKVCYYAGYMVGENGYCVYGERKMDGDEREDTSIT